MRTIVIWAIVLGALAIGTAHSATIDDLVITEVDPLGDKVEITNTATTSVTTPGGLPFCHLQNYFSIVPGGTVFSAAESKTFTVSGLDDSSGDVWLYRNSSDFTNSANMITGMAYGVAPANGRMSEAVGAGLWPSESATVPSPGSGENLQLTTLDPTDPQNWISRLATTDAFYGTGASIPDPIVPAIPKSSAIIELETVIDGLVSPLGLTAPDDGTGRLVVWDQRGTATLIKNGIAQAPRFLDVSADPDFIDARPGFDERGFLGLALHPNFASNPKVYTYITEKRNSGTADFTTTPLPGGVDFDSQAVISEWTMSTINPDIVDPSTRRELLRIDQPQSNHNGGTVRFGPNGHLFISLGDGGGRDDEGDGQRSGHAIGGNAQDPSNIYGAILRIDVDNLGGSTISANGEYWTPNANPFASGGGLPEIYAYGFRNPYAFSFDNLNGDLLLADAGQNDIEEIDKIALGDNHGWPLKEGSFFFDPKGLSIDGSISTLPTEPLPTTLTDPIAEYDHDEGTSNVGGFVYRGAAIPNLAGRYIFGDFSLGFGAPNGRLFHLDASDEILEFQIGPGDRPLGLYIKGFGQDSNGEIYVCGSTTVGPSGATGVVVKIVPTPARASSGIWQHYM